ncbi:MAG: HdeD family acid-resistance protein [Pseudomonadota bacterium]
MATQAGSGWGWVLAYGVFSILLGIMAFAWPFSATLAATIVIGSFFLASGILAVAAGLGGRSHDASGYAVLWGIVSIILGLILAFDPVNGALSLTLLVLVWLIVRGVMEIFWGFRLRRLRGPLIGLGAINLVLALLLLATVPWSALTLPGYILGASFLFGGVGAVAAAIDHRKGARAF